MVLEKLGWGHFSTVWRCQDRSVGSHVAMKVQKSANHYYEAALDEIRLLEDVKEAAGEKQVRVVELIDHFEHAGPNGKRMLLLYGKSFEHFCVDMCMVFEMLGDNLLTVIKKFKYKGIPLEYVKVMSRQILEGLAFLHEDCSIIHTDLKPENILLQVPLEKEKKKEVVVNHSTNGNGEIEKLKKLLKEEMSVEERKKLKKKMKRKKQKQKKMGNQADEELNESFGCMSTTNQWMHRNLLDQMQNSAALAACTTEVKMYFGIQDVV